MASIKGPGDAPKFDKKEISTLQIGIVHSRWNSNIISELVNGSVSTLQELGVPSGNIHIQSVPGSYELPFAVQRMTAASQTTLSSSAIVSAATDLLSMGGDSSSSNTTSNTNTKEAGTGGTGVSGKPNGPLDAIIAIGVLIKGSTMHFEYIADATSHGLMKVQLETGCPVIFGLLTCLTEEQAQERAGIKGANKHNHGNDWAQAAVELGVKRRGWLEGKFIA